MALSAADGSEEPISPMGTAPSGLSPETNNSSEPFPATTATYRPERSRENSDASTIAGRIRSASKKFEESSIPVGFMDATGSIASGIPSLADIRRGSFSTEGWSGEGQLKEKTRKASLIRRGSGDETLTSSSARGARGNQPPHDSLPEAVEEPENTSKLDTIASDTLMSPQGAIGEGYPPKAGENLNNGRHSTDSNVTPTASATKPGAEYRTEPFENGYQFPPKHTWGEATIIGLKGFWGFFLTPLGFLVTIYGLNVIAWGGMIFLLLCNASPAMCYPTCDDINSPRRVWIEIDAQVLTALFCVTGFGLIPWRFRDLYFLLRYRFMNDQISLRRLAGINRGWFRLQGSQDLPILLGPADIEAEYTQLTNPNCIPFPIGKIPDVPLTGIRAPATPIWKLDYVIWMNCWNTFLQAVLSGIMWGLNRYDRPSWATGLFVALACIVAGLAGVEMFLQGKKVKGIEGVPVSDQDQERLKMDRELGVTHWNNLKDEKPKEPKAKKDKKGKFHRAGPNVDNAVELEESATHPATVPRS